MNLFTISSNDQSLYYLGQIFGHIGGVLPANNAPVLLGVMFKVLNTAALTVGAMIVVYTTIAGLLSTASEGEFLGKKWSGLWVPVRTVLGIVGLFPSSGGYCAIQVIIMWLILQGIGLADTLWTTVLNLIQNSGGSAYVTLEFPNVSGLIKPPLKNLFTSLVCYESVAYDKDLDSKNSTYSYPCTSASTDARCKTLPVFDSSKKSYDLEPCGKLNFCDVSAAGTCAKPNSLGCILCKAQHQALPEIIGAFDAVAKKFAQLDYEYQKFYYYSTLQTIDKVPQWIQDFCTAKEKRCCVNDPTATSTSPSRAAGGLAPNNAKIPSCSSTFFAGYPPYGDFSNSDLKDKGRVGEAALKEIYVPYGIKPYVDIVDFITAAADQYIAVLTNAYITFNSQAPVEGLRDWQREAQRTGWVLAGTYYYQIAKGNAARQIKMNNLPAFSMEIPKSPIDSNSTLGKTRNNIEAMPELYTAISQAIQNPALASVPNFAAVNEGSSLNAIVKGLMKSFSGSESNGVATNALTKLTAAGWSLIADVQILFWVTTAVVAIATALSSINFMVVGTGMTSSPLIEGVKAFWGMISPFWMLGLSALFSMGVLLGLYVPLIPYTIFTMGVIGWFIATLEAMVAGPIIALGILSPSGQHELLGKSEPAVLIIFNLILRPSLMVFGLMASLFLANIAVTLLNQTYLKVAGELIEQPLVVEQILLAIGYTSLIVMVLNKVFTLIHVIPEKVLTYIGGQAISYGEAEGLAGAKQTLEGAASGISGGAKEAGGAPTAAATKIGQDEAHHKAEADRLAGVKADKEAKGGGGGGDGNG
jgi:hypothetical protein